MSRKTLKITAAVYVLAALIWAVNFFINWSRDGRMTASTGLFGMAAVCFAISAVLNIIRICRMKKED